MALLKIQGLTYFFVLSVFAFGLLTANPVTAHEGSSCDCNCDEVTLEDLEETLRYTREEKEELEDARENIAADIKDLQEEHDELQKEIQKIAEDIQDLETEIEEFEN